ncbi:hypothetical protein GCM10020255_008000 [Rhodococcus baikonurensis]
MPSAIRDIATVRIAFRCKTLPAAASILGDDISEVGLDLNPTSISESQRGVAVATTKTGDLVRVQCSLIDDDTIDRTAASAWPQKLWTVDTGVLLGEADKVEPPAVVAQSEPVLSLEKPETSSSVTEPERPARRKRESRAWDVVATSSATLDQEADPWASLLVDVDESEKEVVKHPPLPKPVPPREPRPQPRKLDPSSLSMFDGPARTEGEE